MWVVFRILVPVEEESIAGTFDTAFVEEMFKFF